MYLDIINGLFELCGGFLCWLNVKQILKDQSVKGVYWPIQIFFSAWGIWNLFFYSGLSQWMSFYGGIFLAIGNISWVILAAYYSRKSK
jgi:hypothetical protein